MLVSKNLSFVRKAALVKSCVRITIFLIILFRLHGPVISSSKLARVLLRLVQWISVHEVRAVNDF